MKEEKQVTTLVVYVLVIVVKWHCISKECNHVLSLWTRSNIEVLLSLLIYVNIKH